MFINHWCTIEKCEMIYDKVTCEGFRWEQPPCRWATAWWLALGDFLRVCLLCPLASTSPPRLPALLFSPLVGQGYSSSPSDLFLSKKRGRQTISPSKSSHCFPTWEMPRHRPHCWNGHYHPLSQRGQNSPPLLLCTPYFVRNTFWCKIWLLLNIAF